MVSHLQDILQSNGQSGKVWFEDGCTEKDGSIREITGCILPFKKLTFDPVYDYNIQSSLKCWRRWKVLRKRDTS